MARVPTLARLAEVCPPDWEADAAEIPTVDAREYSPLEYQAAFMNSDSRRPAMIGGIGIGKTTVGAYTGWTYSVLANPEPHIGIVGAPTFPMLRDTTIPKVREVFPAECLAGGSWSDAFSKSHMTLTLVTGTVIVFRSLDGDNYNKLRGIEAAWGWVDEAGLLKTEEAWRVLCGRLRARARRRAAWATMTPKGENWAAEQWITKPSDGYEYFHATIYDNPYLPADYIADLEATYSEAFIRQELYGEIVSLQGAVYPDLSDDLWPNGNVLVYEPDPHRPTSVEIDFGYRNPAIQAVQQVQVVHPETGKAETLDVVVWELQDRNGNPPRDMVVDQWLDIIQGLPLKITAAYGDPAGDSANDQTHISSARKVVDRLRIKFQKPTKPWQRSKERGEETTRGRIKAHDGTRRLVWAAKPEQDRRGKQVLHAPNSFRAFRNLQYAEQRPGMPVANESLKDGVNDHATDAARYRNVLLYGRENVHRLWTPTRIA